MGSLKIETHTLNTVTDTLSTVVSLSTPLYSDLLAKGLRSPSDLGHSFVKPKTRYLRIRSFVKRMKEGAELCDNTLLTALLYLDRINANHPRFMVTETNVHRLFLALVSLAAKMLEDR